MCQNDVQSVSLDNLKYIINTINIRIESHYTHLYTCKTTTDENLFVLSILNILGSKDSDDRLIRQLQLISHPSGKYQIMYNQAKKEIKKIHNIAIDIFNRHKHRIPKDNEVSGIFNVGMIIADAMIQNEYM